MATIINNPFEALYQKLEKIESAIVVLANRPMVSAPDPIEDITVVNGASEITHLSIQTIYEKVAANEIPFMKKGKRLYFSRKELIAWIQEGRKKTNAELAEEADQFLTRKKAR
jgi:excisionase family DNA binding protein